MQAVVLMGGLGTRLGLVDRPKSMADVHGKPFFDYQLCLMKRWGIRRILFLIGYKGEAVRNHYGNGEAFGVDIRYSEDGCSLKGTGGALKRALPLLENDFFLLYGDSFMDIDYQEMLFHYMEVRQAGKKGLMAILHNRGRLDRSNVLYVPGQKLLYDKYHPSECMEYIDYGVSILSKEVLENSRAESFDLAELMGHLSEKGHLSGHVVQRRFYEIGSPQSLDEFRAYAKQRFFRENRAVFFDRDGVVNELVYCEETEQLDSPFRKEDFHYRKGILDTMRWLQQRGYLLFLVTNQPAAAKGTVPLQKIYALHAWLTEDLQKKGISLEFIQMCPHHPTGTPRTKEQFLVRSCNCRKPKSGLLADILSVYHIDREKSCMVGDSYTDVLAARDVGIPSVLWGTLKCDVCQKLEGIRPNWVITNIKEVKRIMGECEMSLKYIEDYLTETIDIAKKISRKEIGKSIQILQKTKQDGGRLFILGVGGSAANASHAVNDFRKIGGIETYAPTDNIAELTARTNDEGWETTFVEWLKTSKLGKKDAVMVFSVGGGSEATSLNIVNALKLAKDRGAGVISIVSRNGGYARKVSDSCILVPVVSERRITPHAEGWQGIVWHLMVNALKDVEVGK